MEPQENILCTSTYFIGSDEVAEKFDLELVNSLINAQEKSDSENLQIKFALKVTVVSKEKEGWGVTENADKFLDNAFLKLRNAKIDYWVENWSSGPTRTQHSALFDRGAIVAGFKAIVMLQGLDQFPPNKNLATIQKLVSSMEKGNYILLAGARSSPVILSANKENNYLRRIMEGFVNLAIKKITEDSKHKLDFLEDYGHPNDEAYKSHGDFVNEVYLFNPNHKKAMEFLDELTKTSKKNNFFGFEGEYYFNLLAGKYGNLALVYAYSIPNPFENEDTEKEKTKIIEKQIKGPLSKLKNTSITKPLIETIKGEGKETLLKYYSKEQVDEVSKYMLEALE